MKNIISRTVKALILTSAFLMLICMPANAKVAAKTGPRVKTTVKAVETGKTVTFANASNVTSSRMRVAAVQRGGSGRGSGSWKVTAGKCGKTKLKVFDENGNLTKKIYLLVYSDKTLSYDTSAAVMAKDSSARFQTNIPSGCKIKYSSSDSGVADVNGRGRVTAKSKGTATIHANVYYRDVKVKSFKKKVTVRTPNNISNYVFIGDSRTVRMHKHVGNPTDVTWSAKSGQGYDWMMAEGIKDAESSIRRNTAVFILLGANDLWNIDNYIEAINQKALEWKRKGARVIFCAVGPVDSSLTSKITNEDIEVFNKKLKTGLVNAEYFDLYTLLNKYGFSTHDGLHYTRKTSKFIYYYLRSYALYTEF